MYVIGLTGGVGSGKTVATKMLAKMADAECLITDDLGHVVMEAGTLTHKQIVEAFGTEILCEDGKIDRQKLSQIVFAQKEKLECLNRIVHPGVLNYIEKYIEERKEQEGYILLESAILFESGCDKFCHEVWYIYVSDSTRVERLSANRGYTEEKSRTIMQRQQSEQEFRRVCNRVIANAGTMEQLEQSLKQALEQCEKERIG